MRANLMLDLSLLRSHKIPSRKVIQIAIKMSPYKYQVNLYSFFYSKGSERIFSHIPGTESLRMS